MGYLSKDISFGEYINKNIVVKSVELERIWDRYSSLKDFSVLSIDRLFELYCLQLQKHYELYEYCWIPEILQDPDYGIDHWLTTIVKTYDSDFNRKDLINFYPQHSSTVYTKHEDSIIRIAEQLAASPQETALFRNPLKYIRTGVSSNIVGQIRKLIKKYAYLGYHGYDERRLYDMNYYLDRIRFYVMNPKERYRASPNAIVDEKTEIISHFSMDEKRLFNVYSMWGVLKSRRRLAQLKNFYFLDMIIEELAYRKKVPEDYVRFMTPEEIKKLFKYNVLPENIDRRPICCMYYLNSDRSVILTDHNFDNFENINRNTTLVQNTLKGNIACPGHVVGQAYIIERKSDINTTDMGYNPILVSKEADPDIFVILNKVSAIVTDQGGITCHIASLAREKNIPCIVGTQYATRMIKHGDWLEIDANSGIVKILE